MRLLNYSKLFLIAALCSLLSTLSTFASDDREGPEIASSRQVVKRNYLFSGYIKRNDSSTIEPLILCGKEVNIFRHFVRFMRGHERIYDNPSPTQWRNLFESEIERAIEVAEYGGLKFCKIRIADDVDYGRYDRDAFVTLWRDDGPKYLKKFREYFPAPTGIWSSLEEYLKKRQKSNEKAILIVGCGHRNNGQVLKGDHKHLDAWCIDVNNPEDFDPQERKRRNMQRLNPLSKGEHYSPVEDPIAQEPYVQYTHADAELNITNQNFPDYYVGVFDVVVLERIWDSSLREPYTLYNASRALKKGGELIIDIHETYQLRYPYECQPYKSIVENIGYKLHPYISSHDPKDIKKFYQRYDPRLIALINKYGDLIAQIYDKNQVFMGAWDSPPEKARLEEDYWTKYFFYYGANEFPMAYEFDDCFRVTSMAHYLCDGLFFQHPIFVQRKVLPYNKRESNFLSVTKTEITQELEKELWHEGIFLSGLQ